MPSLSGFDHIVLTVADIGRSVRFYSRVLGMQHETFTAADGSTRNALIFGNCKINLHLAAAPFRPHAVAPRPGSADICLLTEDSMQDWIAHLTAAAVEVEEGPVRRTGARGPILSIYLRDPDGSLIEISRYV